MMRRVVLVALTLCTAGCSGTGFFDFLSDTNSIRRNVNQPIGDSLNMRRIRAESTDVPALETEPGNIWPGPVQAEPTLEDLENNQVGRGAPELASPGSPDFRNNQQPNNQPPGSPPRGSSTPPGSTQPGLPNSQVPPVAQRPVAPRATPPTGLVTQTPRGPAVNTGGGTGGYGTVTTPNGQGAILIPNGNGTSTLVHPDGTIDTVPTAR